MIVTPGRSPVDQNINNPNSHGHVANLVRLPLENVPRLVGGQWSSDCAQCLAAVEGCQLGALLGRYLEVTHHVNLTEHLHISEEPTHYWVKFEEVLCTLILFCFSLMVDSMAKWKAAMERASSHSDTSSGLSRVSQPADRPWAWLGQLAANLIGS